jgi:hypothetical protein
MSHFELTVHATLYKPHRRKTCVQALSDWCPGEEAVESIAKRASH